MSRHARQKRPVAPWQRLQSVLPMQSAVVLRRLQRGQFSSPHSFFWRQKWQVMPAGRHSNKQAGDEQRSCWLFCMAAG
jgi:hypothetical protein